MKLHIDGIEHSFTPLKQFRQTHHLPDSFDVHLFEPKDFTGLAALDNAGAELNGLRQSILDAIPARLTPADLIAFFDRLQTLFDELLTGINTQVGLKPEEIEFAVAGFGDVNQMLTYALIRSQKANAPLPDFEALYQGWLSNSVRIASRSHRFSHRGADWRIQIISSIYGRIGLRIDTGSDIFYVQDAQLACPAENYMMLLLAEISKTVLERLVRT